MRFTEILFVATVVTGLIWLIDSLFFKRKRLAHLQNVKNKERPEPLLVEYCKAFFPILLIVLIIRSFLVEPFRIPSGSMRPTLLEGDFILVNKFDYGLRIPFTGKQFIHIGEPKRGDVIVFKHIKRNGESIDMIKRVVGLPGDHIEYKNKTIYVNGKAAKQEFVQDKNDKDPERSDTWPVKYSMETLGNIKHDIFMRPDRPSVLPHARFDNVVVPENSYFGMGDNRDNSDDSRYWGFVEDTDIIGRAMGIWMSINPSVWGFNSECLRECVRWPRIGLGLGTTVKELPTNGDSANKKDSK